MLFDVDWIENKKPVCETHVLLKPVLSSNYEKEREEYLVSILSDPEKSKVAWKKQSQPVREMADGFVSIKLGEVELLPADLWTEISGFWWVIMQMVDGYLETGKANVTLTDQPFSLGLADEGKATFFEVNGIKHLVSPKSFLLGLLDGADDFYAWVLENIGGFSDEDVIKPKLLRKRILGECV